VTAKLSHPYENFKSYSHSRYGKKFDFKTASILDTVTETSERL